MITAPDDDARALSPSVERHAAETRVLARLCLAAFLVTFALCRITVICIMDRKLPPQLFLHVHKTHIHHLHYGIFILSLTGAYFIFTRPTGLRLTLCAIIYAIGLGLIFDEFAIWLHLGGPYWQRADYYAVAIVALLLALIAYGSNIRQLSPRHYVTIGALVAVSIFSGHAVKRSMKWAHQNVGVKLYHLEEHGPS